VYRCESGNYVKTYATMIPAPFGVTAFRVSGSACDASGKALVHNEGFAIHKDPHEEYFDSPPGLSQEECEKMIIEKYEAAHDLVVSRVDSAMKSLSQFSKIALRSL
jgi:glutathionylspermidine synthase